MISPLPGATPLAAGSCTLPILRFGDAMPKTRSGKVVRRLLRSVAKGEAISQDTSTVDNPAVISQFADSI
ncbi:hypothetical protein [Paraburkholderia elongata]|uniref:AMP-binding enzyme C-terminal domain-containing protein n=1 Tax=Paraburkholderia elongata TaxID=2675747 RepID=A0A972NMI1_9BURK|nr:hypothetical protein [Paraburkholderia elongata]NPT56136.1 hypothetical protein [Paraburkholderia elongata]